MLRSLAWADIDLSAIKHNYQLFLEANQKRQVMAVIKADSYGHGLIEVARAIPAHAYAVARLKEAAKLREAGIRARIVVLSELFDREQIEACQALNVEPVIHSLHSVNALRSAELSQHPLNIWLKYNSGMNRLGLDDAALLNAHKLIEHTPSLNFEGILTHLASADETGNPKNQAQLDRLKRLYVKLPTGNISIANSAASLFSPDHRKDWLRVGISLYGINPSQTSNALSGKLIPAMTLSARVIDVKHVPKGDTVGYNETWIAKRDSVIAVIGIGYADGYPRHAQNGTPVMINGHQYPLAGRVSMDMITVDITNTKEPISTGDIAELWGKTLSASVIAEQCDTIAYELFTGIGNRVDRIYHNDDSNNDSNT